jgi:hypothetical protein
VAFERYMALGQSLENEVQAQEALRRAATVLQHSLLYRVMQVGRRHQHTQLRQTHVPKLLAYMCWRCRSSSSMHPTSGRHLT